MTRPVARRGAPLMMLVLLLSGWGGIRTLWWQNPFGTHDAAAMTPASAQLARASRAAPSEALLATITPAAGMPDNRAHSVPRPVSSLWRAGREAGTRTRAIPRQDGRMLASPPIVISAPQAAASVPQSRASDVRSAPFLPEPAPSRGRRQRWSVDAWAFWREGSDAALVSQGRVPIYGASQAGGVLQYRIAPDAVRDPRLYLRAYRALLERGESELALGGSARPLARVPLRVAGEVRYTDTAFGDAIRPAAYAVTELAPLRLPYGTRFEAYAQAGWVGGRAATPFADGQASLLREIGGVAVATNDAARFAIGVGAWGGAQEGAERVDLGPTARLDFRLGQVPARISVDWRERVAGEAAPESGVAATLSTQF